MNHSMSAPDQVLAPADRRICAIQTGFLAICALLLVRDDLAGMVAEALVKPDSAHLLVAPVLIALLWWSRRRQLPAASSRGSLLGPLLLIAGTAIFILCTFPFAYLQPRRLALPILLGGAILTTIGWRGLRFWAPMLLLVALAIPIGARFFVALIVRPETLTLQVVQSLLDVVPGWSVMLEGLDIFYTTDGAAGTIALGQPNRGAQHVLAMASVMVFAHFFRVRPIGHLVAFLVLGLPILLIANIARVLTIGVWTILAGSEPLDTTPMIVGTVVGLVVAYFGTLLPSAILTVLFAPSPEDEE